MTKGIRASQESSISLYPIHTLKEAFDIGSKEIISLVGAGGKTTLMFALARELTERKKVVITTATTKIFPPSFSDSACVFTSSSRDTIIDFIHRNGMNVGHITLAAGKSEATGKLLGIKPELVLELIDLEPVLSIIVEADGAARRPLKVPNPAHEPVIPQSTSVVIPVIGIEALGRALTEEHVFRSEIAAQLTGIPLGETLSPQVIAELIVHPSGIARGSPKRARIVPFINKVDLCADLSEARDIAVKILEAHHAQIDRVVLGQARLKPPVREVVCRGGAHGNNIPSNRKDKL
jgi:probable selenium-dependent hydroxylase accessory protein YqeC